MPSTSNHQAPQLLYGTAWKKERTATLVRAALDEGFRAIDTACQPKHYHEPGVGEALSTFLEAGGRRDELYVQTKFTPVDGQDPARIPYDPHASLTEQVQQSLAASLRNLRTDYLDCLVLHSPLARLEQTLEVWRAMEEAVDSGSVRAIGLSNCYELSEFTQVHQRARIKPAVLQNRFYEQTDYDRALRDFCLQHSVQYQSFWTLTANPQLLTHPQLTAIAARHGRTPAQVMFRWLTHLGVAPLTGTTSRAHMREDLEIFAFELSADERRALDALL